MVFVAAVAECYIRIALCVVVPDTFGTASADCGVIFDAVIAKNLTIEIVVISFRKMRPADGTSDFFVHKNFSFKFILNFFKGIIYIRKFSLYAG